MTTQLPGSDEHSPVDVAEAREPLPARGATRSRSSRAPDYRLRGLDLDAHAFAEAPRRAVRKRHPSRRRRRRRHVIQFVVVLAMIALVAVLLRATVVEPFTVSSSSMVPALRAGTDVLVVKSGWLAGSIGTGDIVVIRKPAGVTCSPGGDPSDQLVERVIAVPGQTIRSVRGRIFIDGRRFHERGWYNTRFGETGPVDIPATKVPPKSYFVMGDNRHDGCDSRAFGAVAQSSVIGEVVATIARDGHAYVHFM
jgi:signal peptidase I